MEISDKTIALLIDSDNISQKYFEILTDELNKFGNVTYKRIYGDFTSKNASGWRPLLLQYAISPIQQYTYTTGKNSTDSAMIIDAMDIMYKGKVNCICIATSDSDFTRLATRFKEENYIVIGAGEQKTPQSFRSACDRFLLMDVLLAESVKSDPAPISRAKPTKRVILPKNNAQKNKKSDAQDPVIPPPQIAAAPPVPTVALPKLENLINLATEVLKNNSDADGWMHFSAFMNAVYAKDNSFNPKNYGANKKPITFFKDLDLFFIETKSGVSGIRLK
ncbi:MAG: NYN domain-containing protein [Clostridiales bacterium]|jgi:uncharacterized protein (TIGR00288 family)|nr:NYN domain-containing protein [Clostridiales bacterium]